ncbi:MAG: ATP-binding cassette domain-containing protein, partial [Candidatus Limnocylindrales bacterium]
SPYRLSGGEQRRLSVATALVRRPRLLLLDEPTFGQDRRGWESLVTILEELVEAGTSLVFATHDESFAGRLAGRRIELADGWIVADDGAAEDGPADHAVADDWAAEAWEDPVS